MNAITGWYLRFEGWTQQQFHIRLQQWRRNRRQRWDFELVRCLGVNGRSIPHAVDDGSDGPCMHMGSP